MNHTLPDVLASRLNFDVVVFRGNTRRELLAIALLSLTLTILVLGTLTKLLLGLFLVGLGLSFPCAIPIGWMLATGLQRLKMDKPKGYLKQRCLLWLAEHNLILSPLLTYSGPWSIKRYLCDF